MAHLPLSVTSRGRAALGRPPRAPPARARARGLAVPPQRSAAASLGHPASVPARPGLPGSGPWPQLRRWRDCEEASTSLVGNEAQQRTPTRGAALDPACRTHSQRRVPRLRSFPIFPWPQISRSCCPGVPWLVVAPIRPPVWALGAPEAPGNVVLHSWERVFEAESQRRGFGSQAPWVALVPRCCRSGAVVLGQTGGAWGTEPPRCPRAWASSSGREPLCRVDWWGRTCGKGAEEGSRVGTDAQVCCLPGVRALGHLAKGGPSPALHTCLPAPPRACRCLAGQRRVGTVSS